jgi:hypothetical protein
MVNPLRWRGHEVSRLEAFSDTAFAYALTPIAPTAFCLMGPFHWAWGAQSRQRRRVLLDRLARTTALAEDEASAS